MTERVLGPTGGRRRKRLAFFVPFLALAALILAIGASAGPIGIASGFEDDDGNLRDDAGTGINAGIDWNSFDPTTWTGQEPFRQTSKVFSGWSFKGVEDAQATTSDSGFAGGTKQDDDCPTVITAKAPNKDDLKRIYIASKTGSNGHTYLNLAWVRIPQNTTSASAHVGFEFNQGSTACATGGLVQRMAGDMLIVYDFEGGAGDPVLTLRRWIASGACEISNNTAPCWGPAVNLTASGFAEAKVNTGSSVLDTIAPVDETLQDSEFGEAGIDLTDAGVFPPGTCNSFGKAYAVSRSSGSSGTAQMKDLDGPVDFNLTNCGTITIIKHTSPGGIDQNFSYTSTIAGGQLSCTADATPASFTLNDSGTDTEVCSNVPAGSYTVTEGADPAGFAFADLSCSASGTGTSATPASGNATRVASITMAGGGAVTCTYTNNQQLGAIEITKTRKHAATPANNAHAGVTFTLSPGGATAVTDANGNACFENLAFGAYTVTESVPAGYNSDDAVKEATVNNNATCANNAGEPLTFHNTPLTNVQIKVTSQVTGGTSSVVNCDNNALDGSGSNIDVTASNLEPTDPAVITCTILIDP